MLCSQSGMSIPEVSLELGGPLTSTLVYKVGLGSPSGPRNGRVPPGSPVSPVPGATRPVCTLRVSAEGSPVLLPRALSLTELCRAGRGEDPSASGSATGKGWGGSPLPPWWWRDSDMRALCVMGGSASTSEGLRGCGANSSTVLWPRRGDQGRNPSLRSVPVSVSDPQSPFDSATEPSKGSLTSGSFSSMAARSFTAGTNLLRPAGKQRELNNQDWE